VKPGIVTYKPDNCLRKGYTGLIREIAVDIASNRWLTLQLFKRDMFARYKQSAFGLLWLVIAPLLSVATVFVLSKSGVFNVGEIGGPYPIFAILGMGFWQLFSVALTQSANSMVQAGQMVAKINFSKKSLVVASLGTCVLSFAVQFVLVLILFGVYRSAPSPWILAFPLLMLPMLLLSLGLGFMVALVNAVARDVATALPVVLNFLLFLTPVLYAKRNEGLIATATTYNPLYYLIAVPRDIILRGRTEDGLAFAVSAAVGLAVFVACLTVFHLTEARIAERI